MKTRIFLDSGAYTALTKNTTINLTDYIRFIKANLEYLEVYTNLDCIGNAEETLINQKVMEDCGLKPLPCYEYVALRGMVGGRKESLLSWLDQCWRVICKAPDFIPKNKIHGFGLTSPELIARYPWYCMTEEDHSILTRSGWNNLSNLKVGDEILTFNYGKTEWQKIEEIPIFEVHNEKLYKLYNRNFKTIVSENHRWVVSHWQHRDEEYKWRTTKTLSFNDCINRVGMDYNFPTESNISNEQVIILSWFWTDGTINKRKRYTKNNVVIYQSEKANPEKCKIIREALIRSGEIFCESITENIISFELYGEMSDWLLSIAPNKKLPVDLPYKLTKEQTELFINNSVLADGTISGLKRIKGFEIKVKKEIKKENLEVIRIMCLLLGIPTSVYEYNNYKGLRSSSIKHIYVNKLKKEEQIYSGKLWCVKVPSEAFFVKCNNHIYVTGNSVDSSSWVQYGKYGMVLIPRGSFSVPPWRLFMSTRSSKIGKDGEIHFDNLTKHYKALALNYISSKGFSLGSSEFKRVHNLYRLKDNEAWADIKEKIVEIILEKGLRNSHELRDQFNTCFFLDLQNSVPEWPWPWKKGRNDSLLCR
jgi:hypothetical protein